MAAPTPEELDRRFTYHKPHGTQAERYTAIRAYARDFADVLVTLVPDSRELALALTKLEESVMWANAGIARNEPEPSVPPTE